MPALLKVYCIHSEFIGGFGINPLVDLFGIFSIFIDNQKAGDIVSDLTKTFPLQSGPHQISLRGLVNQSSLPVNLDAKDGLTYSMVCGITRKGRLFIEQESSPSAADRSDGEYSYQKPGSLLRASARLFFLVISGILSMVIFTILAPFLHVEGWLWIPFLFACALVMVLILLFLSWIARKASHKP
ncbi:MAG: hypothetical protein JW929_00415 [Anaerolineales bacterium]|nr:hypothetical protein [Anaerolineales bacterium]